MTLRVPEYLEVHVKSAKLKTTDRLIADLRAPWWKIWISPTRRAATAWSLGTRNDLPSNAVECLSDALRSDTDVGVRSACAACLKRLSGSQSTIALQALRVALADQSDQVKCQALKSLACFGDSTAATCTTVNDLLRSKNAILSVWACYFFAKVGPSSEPYLLKFAEILSVNERATQDEAFAAYKNSQVALSLTDLDSMLSVARSNLVKVKRTVLEACALLGRVAWDSDALKSAIIDLVHQSGNDSSLRVMAAEIVSTHSPSSLD